VVKADLCHFQQTQPFTGRKTSVVRNSSPRSMAYFRKKGMLNHHWEVWHKVALPGLKNCICVALKANDCPGKPYCGSILLLGCAAVCSLPRTETEGNIWFSISIFCVMTFFPLCKGKGVLKNPILVVAYKSPSANSRSKHLRLVFIEKKS